ncbi:MAG TPA: hypothetical protein VFB21_09770 [Chthonomonadaceae bacterium]|nr:hypothetical protein [Chthonomonadaceae bacterium]
MDKANEYAIESLKQLLTLSSAILALTITFLKDLMGDSASEAHAPWLVPLSWVFLLLCILHSWGTIVSVADAIGNSSASTPVYALKSDPTGAKRNLFVRLASWFFPTIQTHQQNRVRKRAISAQNYFVLGLICLGLFAALNMGFFFHKKEPKKDPAPQPASIVVKPADCHCTLPLAPIFIPYPATPPGRPRPKKASARARCKQAKRPVRASR